MKGKFLLVGLLVVVAIVGLLQLQGRKKAVKDVHHLEVAAGNIEYGDEDDEDLSSPEPFVHCYPVSGPNDLDIRTRMDFEARTTKAWVPAPEEADDGEFCLKESQQAIDDRLAELEESE